MNDLHLIITTAHISNNTVRINDTIKSIKSAYDILYNHVQNVYVLETVKTIVPEYLSYKSAIVHALKEPYKHNNHGIKWANNLKSFLTNSDEINHDSVIILLVGRYFVLNNNIINIINDNIIKGDYVMACKSDKNVFKHDKGVHAFYITARAGKFLQFVDFLMDQFKHTGNGTPIEWTLKNFMDSQDDCVILTKDTNLGVMANTSGGRQFNA